MKKTILTLAAIMISIISAQAIDDTTVEINYNGTTATVSVASNISSYITVSSGSSSHVNITQSSSFNPDNFITTDNTSGEITFILSGSTSDGEFYLNAPTKATISLDGVTLTNATPTYSGAAIYILGGKRYKISAKKETTSTLKDAASGEQGGCVYAKGHLELQGNGTLNVYGNCKHAIKSTEYMSVKNLTLNIPTAAKDGMHSDEYFLMESGTVNISNVGDDGIQVEIDVNDTQTAETANHEAENSGNFYQDGGTLTISSVSTASTTGLAINAEGTEYHTGGTYNDNTTGIEAVESTSQSTTAVNSNAYDLSGRLTGINGKGIKIINKNGKNIKIIAK